MYLKEGTAYYISNDYFTKYDTEGNMVHSKTTDQTGQHGRPYICIKSDPIIDTHWMAPVSTRFEKYNEIMSKKIDKYGFCNTLQPVNLRSKQGMLLLQNIVPVSEKYIRCEYKVPRPREDGTCQMASVHLTESEQKEANKSAKTLLKKEHNGVHILMTDILQVEIGLLQEKQEQAQEHSKNVLEKEAPTKNSTRKDRKEQPKKNTTENSIKAMVKEIQEKRTTAEKNISPNQSQAE